MGGVQKALVTRGDTSVTRGDTSLRDLAGTCGRLRPEVPKPSLNSGTVGGERRSGRHRPPSQTSAPGSGHWRPPWRCGRLCAAVWRVCGRGGGIARRGPAVGVAVSGSRPPGVVPPVQASRPPAPRRRLCVLCQRGDQLVAGPEQFLFVDDVVAVEYFMPVAATAPCSGSHVQVGRRCCDNSSKSWPLARCHIPRQPPIPNAW